jgi:hypothetical protein
MLLAQVDMFLLELITDVIAIYFVTGWYIKNRAIDNLNIANASVAAVAAADASSVSSASSAVVGYVAPAANSS